MNEKPDPFFKRIVIAFLATILIFGVGFSTFCFWIIRENRKYYKEKTAQSDQAVLRQIESAFETGILSLTYAEIGKALPSYDLGTKLDALRGRRELRGVRLETGSRPFADEGVDVIASLPELEFLSLNASYVNDAFFDRLGKHPTFRRLSLNRCPLRRDQMERLAEMENLRELAIFSFQEGDFRLFVDPDPDSADHQTKAFLEAVGKMKGLRVLILDESLRGEAEGFQTLLPETRIVFLPPRDYFDDDPLRNAMKED